VTPDDLEELEEKVSDLPGRVDAIIGTVRKIATELRPPVLTIGPGKRPLNGRFRNLKKTDRHNCHFHSSFKHADLDPERATAVFRIFQETLTNVIRHADAHLRSTFT